MASGVMKVTQSLLLLVMVLLSGPACSHVDALTVDDLYPFDADNVITDYALVPLPYPVPVFGTASLSGAYINPEGALHFRQRGFSIPAENVFPAAGAEWSMVAAFWSPLTVDCADCTGMSVRAVVGDDTALLANITRDVRSAFPTEPLATGFNAEAALIATWINVKLCCDDNHPLNTFQAVMAFNRGTVFVGLLYPELKSSGILDTTVQAGFNLGDGVRGFRLPTSFATSSFGELSNVGQAGKWWFGLTSTSSTTLGTFAYIDEPAATYVCDVANGAGPRLTGGAGVDACGHQRVMDWDLNNDGVFDDATDTTKPSININELRLAPGVYPIRARVTSPSPCVGDDATQFFNTTLTLTAVQPVIRYVLLDTATGNDKPYVGEVVHIDVFIDTLAHCNPYTTTIDCGAGAVAGQEEGFCRWSTVGNKTVVFTITQNGLNASKSYHTTVVAYKQGCSSDQYPPGGRSLGQRGCDAVYWTYSQSQYPVGAGIRPDTKLPLAFASRAPEDAAVIRSFVGNRTMEHAIALLVRGGHQPLTEVERFAGEAAVALLNALTVPYPLCPRTVKYKFRQALKYVNRTSGELSEAAGAVWSEFIIKNEASIGGCSLPYPT